MALNNGYIIGSLKKLPSRHATWCMPLLLSGIMSGIISAINLIRLNGISGHALNHWSEAWLLSWLIAFPTVMLVLPLVRYLVRLIVNLSTEQ